MGIKNIIDIYKINKEIKKMDEEIQKKKDEIEDSYKKLDIINKMNCHWVKDSMVFFHLNYKDDDKTSEIYGKPWRCNNAYYRFLTFSNMHYLQNLILK